MIINFGLLASFLVYSCYALEDEGIIGGVKVKPHELKYQVSVQQLDVKSCGGGIIHKQFIITAAHCVIDEDNEFVNVPMSIIAGTNFLDEDLNTADSAVKYNVIKAYVPATFNGSHDTPIGDIAVLKLDRKMDLGSSSILSKLNLPPSTEKKLSSRNSYENITATIAGFGWDKVKVKAVEIDDNIAIFEDGSSNGYLLKADALVVPNANCQSFYNNKIYNSQICAKVTQLDESEHQGVCSGDSGGPLVYDNTIIGTVSYNRLGCDDRERPAVYTRVSAYRTFIKNAINSQVNKDMRVKNIPLYES